MNKKGLLLAFVFLFCCVGCTQRSLHQKVSTFGEAKFCEAVLRFSSTHSLDPEVQKVFSPKRVEEHLSGVVLIYSDDDRALSGIYVDMESLHDLGGSGVSIEAWGSRVGWLTEKKRAAVVRR